MRKGIKILAKVNGGFGTVLVRANFLYCLYEYLGAGADVQIYAVAHRSADMNDAIFKGVPGISWYGTEDEWQAVRQKKFDLVFELDLYPRIISFRKVCSWRNRKFAGLVEAWRSFIESPGLTEYRRNLREAKQYEFRRCIIQGKGILDSADIGGLIGVGREYRMPVACGKDENSVLRKFGLLGKSFITVQRGINPKLGVNESPRMWPSAYYEELIALIKDIYPEYCIVQLGESVGHCIPLKGVDISLVGLTEWDDLKVLLGKAVLHIDGECGMVHLRKALHAGPSVVMFGTNPVAFNGYDGNINLVGDGCSGWCAEIDDGWQYRCPRGYEVAPCMKSLSPEMVFDAIRRYFSGDVSVLCHKEPPRCYESQFQKY